MAQFLSDEGRRKRSNKFDDARDYKKTDMAKPLKDFATSAYSLPRPPASAELRFIKSSDDFRRDEGVLKLTRPEHLAKQKAMSFL